MLMSSNMEEIFQGGLHEFLNDFIAKNNRLTETLSDDYNFV